MSVVGARPSGGSAVQTPSDHQIRVQEDSSKVVPIGTRQTSVPGPESDPGKTWEQSQCLARVAPMYCAPRRPSTLTISSHLVRLVVAAAVLGATISAAVVTVVLIVMR